MSGPIALNATTELVEYIVHAFLVAGVLRRAGWSPLRLSLGLPAGIEYLPEDVLERIARLSLLGLLACRAPLGRRLRRIVRLIARIGALPAFQNLIEYIAERIVALRRRAALAAAFQNLAKNVFQWIA